MIHTILPPSANEAEGVVAPPSAPARLDALLARCVRFGADVENQLQIDAAHAAAQGLTPHEEFFLSNKSLQLHPHQVTGIRWMMSLFKNAVNGLLADEMGLGKTVQVIAFLSSLYGQRYFGTHLIVVPLSTMDNWRCEFQRWCPWVPLVVYHGNREKRVGLREWIRSRFRRSWKMQADLSARSRNGESVASLVQDVGCVVLTTYDMLMLDHATICTMIPWDLLIVDEAHRLKNFNCKLLDRLKKCQTEGRLLLTGTPLQNNVKELWSILNFLVPDLFNNVEDFQMWFEHAELLTSSKAPSSTTPASSSNETESVGEEGDTSRQAQLERDDPMRSLTSAIATLRRPPPSSALSGTCPVAAVPTLRSHFPVEQRPTSPNTPSVSSQLFRPPTPQEVSHTLTGMHAALRPFILRRTKHDIPELRIPPKCEVIVYTPLSPSQQQTYESVKIGSKYVNNRLMQLRKVCCHPYLFPEFRRGSSGAPDAASSPKQRLEALLGSSSKFSTLDKMLRLLYVPQLSPAASPSPHSPGASSKPQPPHKVLLFSQMTRVLDIIEEYFELLQLVAQQEAEEAAPKNVKATKARKKTPQPVDPLPKEHPHPFVIPYVRIDGASSLDERIESIRQFSQGSGGGSKRPRTEREGVEQDNDVFATPQSKLPPPNGGPSTNTQTVSYGCDDGEEIEEGGGKVEDPLVFLISTRSGGVGLNLVAADTVILFDCDFNPHNDQQAIDRCHRIGQTRPVMIYRMVAPLTVEDALVRVALRKKRMEKVVLECGQFRMPGEISSANNTSDNTHEPSIVPPAGLRRFLLDAKPPTEGDDDNKEPLEGDNEWWSPSDDVLLAALTMNMTFGDMSSTHAMTNEELASLMRREEVLALRGERAQ